MRLGQVRNATGDTFFAWEGYGLVVNIEVVFRRENANKQLQSWRPGNYLRCSRRRLCCRPRAVDCRAMLVMTITDSARHRAAARPWRSVRAYAASLNFGTLPVCLTPTKQ